MTDYNDKSNLEDSPAVATKAIKTAIANGDETRLKTLLTNEVFDELEKRHFIHSRFATAIIGSIQQRATTPAAILGFRSTWRQEYLAAGHINLLSMLIVATCTSRFAAV